MRLLTWYVLLELLKVFAITLSAMTLLVLLVGVVQEAMRQGLGVGPVLRLLPFLLPNALRFAVPGTILFSACSVYGRMASHNEIVAAKSVGLSPATLLWPGMVLAFLLSLLTVWFNDLAVSWGREGVQRVVLQSVEQIAYGMLRTHKSYRTDQFLINVQQVQGRILIGPTLVVHATATAPAVVVTAREAEIESQAASGNLLFIMRDGAMDVENEASLEFYDQIVHEVPLDRAAGAPLSQRPSQIALRLIGRQIREQHAENAQRRRSLAAELAVDLAAGEFAALGSADRNGELHELELGRERLHRLNTEPWRRWANGFSCFFFVWVGAPLAIRMRNSDFWTSFAACFLPILLVYYPLLAFGVDRAKCGALHPCCVWSGNLILLVGGAYLIRKVLRY